MRSEVASRWFAMVAAALLVAGCGTALRAPDWHVLLGSELSRHPESSAEDVYKFVHQSVYGPGHFIADRSSAERYLREELAGLGEGEPGEPLFDGLSDDPPLIRVNLRPFHARGGDPEALLDALVGSASAVKGDAGLMTTRLAVAAASLRRLGRRPVADEVARLADEMASQGYPAIHHSEAYVKAYRPAYRVVLLPLVAGKLPAVAPD